MSGLLCIHSAHDRDWREVSPGEGPDPRSERVVRARTRRPWGAGSAGPALPGSGRAAGKHLNASPRQNVPH